MYRGCKKPSFFIFIIMEKYLLTIEFRYRVVPIYPESSSEYLSRTITIGVFDTFKEACIAGDVKLEYLESRFKLKVYSNGQESKKERFSKTLGPSGNRNALVSNLGYLQTPFEFYFQIKTLKYDSLEETTDTVLEAIKECKEFKLKYNTD